MRDKRPEPNRYKSNAHLVTLADRATGKLNILRAVPLEVKAKSTTRRQRPKLALQFPPQIGILGLGLGNQISQPRHGYSDT